MDSWTPPAGREDPVGVGVEERPDEDRRRHQQHAEDLISPITPCLLGAPSLFGDLLAIRLDAGFNQCGSLSIRAVPGLPCPGRIHARPPLPDGRVDLVKSPQGIPILEPLYLPAGQAGAPRLSIGEDEFRHFPFPRLTSPARIADHYLLGLDSARLEGVLR